MEVTEQDRDILRYAHISELVSLQHSFIFLFPLYVNSSDDINVLIYSDYILSSLLILINFCLCS
jgi:hypothetical protein